MDADPPPGYEEITLQDDLTEDQLPRYSEATLREKFSGFSNKIKIDGRYSEVNIRDANSGRLLVQAYVNYFDKKHGSIFFRNRKRQHFLEVQSKQIGGNWDRKFLVFHNNMPLGIGEIKNPLTMKLSNTYENRNLYSILSFKVGDIIVLRTPNSRPMCKMHLPSHGSGLKNFYVWSGIVTFPGEEVTLVEQCLCISLTFVYMMNLSLEVLEGNSSFNTSALLLAAVSNRGHGQYQVEIFQNPSEPSNESILTMEPCRNRNLNRLEEVGTLKDKRLMIMIICSCILFVGLWICVAIFHR